jgi:hypothetical protein
MAAYMYDAAYAPSLAECKRKGAVAMSHYMTRSYASSSAPPAAVRAAGMGAVFNWEGYADELKGATRAKGRAVAAEALGVYPAAAPRAAGGIYYSVDTDLAACDEAFRGINDVHKGTGIPVKTYAEGGLIERLHGLGLVQGKQWLSMSEGFGGFRHALSSGLVAVVQMHDAAGNWIGTDVANTDRNTVIDAAALGAWWPANHPLATPAKATAVTGKIQTLRSTPMIVVVDRKDCARLKVRWPGWFLVTPRGAAATPAIEHIDSTSRLHALQATGLPSKTITVATYRGLGGK